MLHMIGYGIGHFYNDLCASMWFTYLMIFFEKVLNFRSSLAGALMLIGQVIKFFFLVSNVLCKFVFQNRITPTSRLLVSVCLSVGLCELGNELGNHGNLSGQMYIIG